MFLVRHGERIDAVDKEWHKTAPVPNNPMLTQNGREQAFKTGIFLSKFLQKQDCIHIISSPFARCIQTSEGIYNGLYSVFNSADTDYLNIRLVVNYGLTEWQTPDYFPVAPSGPPVIETNLPFFESDLGIYPKFPESIAAMRSRYVQTAANLLNLYHSQGPVVLVTHGNAVDSILDSFCPEAEIPEQVKYCCVSHLVKKGPKWESLMVCYTSHLQK